MMRGELPRDEDAPCEDDSTTLVQATTCSASIQVCFDRTPEKLDKSRESR